MKREISSVLAALSLGVCLSAVGCGGEVEAGTTPATAEALSVRHHRVRQTTATPTTTATTAASAAAAATDTASLIAAAQTADGRAIPQPAGPGGACPPVVVAIGFWSCPPLDLDATCSFQAGGATHDCVCSPVSGEGSNPSWLCN
jgi:hypothetical protein